MPHNDEKADASITVTGVCLGCVNPDEKRWEVAFIRHPNHSLMIEVFKETNGQRETFRESSVIPIGSKITIEAADDDTPDPRLFTPTEPDCPENFNLILDIEDDVYDGPVAFKNPEHPITPLFVRGPLLYSVAGRLTEFPVRLIEKGDVNEAAIKTFGHIGTTAGADVKCGQGGEEVVVVVEGEGGFVLRLPRSEGTRYIIEFDNTCPPAPAPPAPTPVATVNGALTEGAAPQNATPATPPQRIRRKTTRAGTALEDHSDFVLYYTVFDPPGRSRKFDLVSDAENRGDGLVCNYSHLGRKTTITPLLS